MNLPVDLRFIGMLSSESAEAAALHGIHTLDALHGEVRGWKVSMEPPQFTVGYPAYAVQVQAELQEGTAFLQSAAATLRNSTATPPAEVELQSLAALVRALLGSNAFFHVD